MKSLLPILVLFQVFACASNTSHPEVGRYRQLASRVTIIRDKWGVPHIYGKTDADAVFGLMYAQCEDNFERVERAYIQRLGRLAAIEGEQWVYEDLKTKLLYDTAAAKADFQKSPQWLKLLLHAFADGINYYLYKHHNVKPVLLRHFEPWFPLLYSDGAYISTQTGGLTSGDIQNFLKEQGITAHAPLPTKERELTGSNGFAIGPSRSATGKALLYINPHVSFYFRTEAHMVSEEGLNAYGAVTWGQFFVFQGFNEHCGWMHTSSQADAADLYAEKISRKGNEFFYEYKGQLRPLVMQEHTVFYKKALGEGQHRIKVYKSHHGPILGIRDGKWLSVREQNRSLASLMQSWLRTKANSLAAFKETMALRANNSTNTMYADRQGNIAYWHGNFIPRRNPAFNWAAPVDGSIPATEWQGLHALEEIVQVHNPASGWIQNCNSTPFSAAGAPALRRANYAAYMAPETENFRSLFAIKELERQGFFTLDKLIGLGYNHHLAAFDSLLPPLFAAYDALPVASPLKTTLQEPIGLMKAWDRKSAINSVATTIAILWGYDMMASNLHLQEEAAGDDVAFIAAVSRNTAAHKRLELLQQVVVGLQRAYGTWKLPWGEINRYQRTSGDLHPTSDDNKESWPVGMASSVFGSLPAFETDWSNTSRGYGYAGNSFVAAVEFGDSIKAKAVHTGGQSFDPQSKHFTDQVPLFIEGRFRDVLFYKSDVLRHAERSYQPGED